MLISAILPLLLTVSDTLGAATVLSSKHIESLEETMSAVSAFKEERLETGGALAPKGLSAAVPNLWMPDYGSAMTSSIYMRGFGSRIDNPALALYVDDVPIVDKSGYDFDFFDIRSAHVLRGPQGTLYGRNAMMGVISVSTLSPAVYQGVKAKVEYGSRNHIKASASVYKGNWSGMVGYRHSDGYFTNQYDGRDCDRYDGAQGRLRYSKDFGQGTKLDNILSLSALTQGAFPYRRWVDGTLQAVNYNDKGAYKRICVGEAAVIKHKGSVLDIHSSTSLHWLSDRMNMDQDYTPESIFTLEQRQNQYALTQDISFRPTTHPDWWNSQTGAFVLIKYNDLSAPVTFKEAGIQSLILDNANAGIPDALGTLDITEKTFPIYSDFGIFTANAALYHESYWSAGNWRFVTGIRLDWEYDRMDYRSESTIHYILPPTLPDPRALNTLYTGREKISAFQVLPKLGVSYRIPDRGWEFRAIVSEGYKAGGFNTQIFSDILQKEMMTGMIRDMGMYPAGQADVSAASTKYKPELGLNAELGVKYGHAWASDLLLSVDACAFYIDCTNQQLTVFPPGKNTGRMMTNAGKSRSFGAEISLSARIRQFYTDIDYGYTNARFVVFNDGHRDYAGNRIPYAPEHTLSGRAGAEIPFASGAVRSLRVQLEGKAAGRIWWNEDNTLTQPFYAELGAYIGLVLDGYTLYIRGENLTNTQYGLFYFKSMGNEFFQTSLPARIRLGISINL